MKFISSFKNTLLTRQKTLMILMNNFKLMSRKDNKNPGKLVKKRRYFFKMGGVVWRKAKDILHLFKGIIIIL